VPKAVMNTAVADDLIDANPCRIRGASNAPRARDVRPATVEELAVIVEAMPDRYRALVLLGAWCALRSGEMLELRRRDVDLVNGTVRVERAVSQVHGRAVVGTPKSAAGIRTVAIPPHVIPAIAHHLEEFVALGPDALLLPAADGVSSLQPSGFYKYWKEARSAAGRPDLRIHDLRHTGATMAAMAGATLAELLTPVRWAASARLVGAACSRAHLGHLLLPKASGGPLPGRALPFGMHPTAAAAPDVAPFARLPM